MARLPCLSLLLLLLLLALFAPSSHGQSRTFNLINYCAEPLWFKVTSGAVASSSCGAGCPLGSTCNSANGNCYWDVPAPSTGKFRIDANGGTNSLTFDFLSNGEGDVWSGNIGACADGTCESDAATCEASGCGISGGSPQNLAEFTLSKAGSDFYDVEVINGFNLPLAVYPLTTQFTADPYHCGSPGAPMPLTDTANCTWQFSPPSIYYNWVATGGAACASQGDCGSGTTCGLSNNVGQSPRFKLTCGKLLGYWTADQVCGVDGSFGFPFNCSQSLNDGTPNTLWNLYACNNGISSCYQSGATSSCCGCVNWQDHGLHVPNTTQLCNSQNPTWLADVYPGLSWLKAACPSVYTFPYDDMSSTFTCSLMKSGNNILNYDLVWCPPKNLVPTKPPTGRSSAGSVFLPLSLGSLVGVAAAAVFGFALF